MKPTQTDFIFNSKESLILLWMFTKQEQVYSPKMLNELQLPQRLRAQRRARQLISSFVCSHQLTKLVHLCGHQRVKGRPLWAVVRLSGPSPGSTPDSDSCQHALQEAAGNGSSTWVHATHTTDVGSWTLGSVALRDMLQPGNAGQWQEFGVWIR